MLENLSLELRSALGEWASAATPEDWNQVLSEKPEGIRTQVLAILDVINTLFADEQEGKKKLASSLEETSAAKTNALADDLNSKLGKLIEGFGGQE